MRRAPMLVCLAALAGTASAEDAFRRPMLDGCARLGEAGEALISISGKEFEGVAVAAADEGGGLVMALGEPGERCIAFRALAPDGPGIGVGEHNIVRGPGVAQPRNTSAPIVLAVVVDPPLAPQYAERGTLHVVAAGPEVRGSFRLEVVYGEVSLTVMGRFRAARPEG